MTLLAAILLALAAVAATPEQESPQFIADILTSCVPVTYDTFIGCDIPVAAYAPDETGYAGWMWDAGEPMTPITGP